MLFCDEPHLKSIDILPTLDPESHKKLIEMFNLNKNDIISVSLPTKQAEPTLTAPAISRKMILISWKN